jgi:hypothetical protein
MNMRMNFRTQLSREKGEDENHTSEATEAHNDSETNIRELEKQLKELQMERKKESISTPGNRKRKGKSTDIAQIGFENLSWTATFYLYR